jgi:hypothetical protein
MDSSNRTLKNVGTHIFLDEGPHGSLEPALLLLRKVAPVLARGLSPCSTENMVLLWTEKSRTRFDRPESDMVG